MGDGSVLAHNAFQRPPHTTSGQLRPGLGGLARVLAPHVPTPGAPVAADRQRQPVDDTGRASSPANGSPCPWGSLASAAVTPPVRLHDTASAGGTIRFEPLPEHL